MGKRKYDSEDKINNKKSKNESNSENVEDCDVHDEQPQNETPTKNEGGTQNLINIKHFRKELTNKQGLTTALTQFLELCLNPDANIDYMLLYLKGGGNSHEILRQITQDNKKNLTLATPTFHLFHLIILKVQSSFPHMIAITEEACRYFLNTFVPTIEIMISENSGPRHRKIILNLLTSIVTLNSDLGIEVLNQIPLTPKNLQYIVEKANYKEKDNVRTAFVHFITSFLVEGHLPLIKALLEKPGLLPLVIPGLIQDEPNAVLMFLNILKKNVVENLLISKTLKLKTFSQQVLHNLFKVFMWKGPPEMSNELKDEFHEEIMYSLSNIILTLFTSHKFGLYFVDNTLGTSDANKNQNLYKCLLTLKRPWENKYQCEVVLVIIFRCPDLHRAIINVVEQSFQPQHSPVWEKTTQFIINLLDKLNPEELSPKFAKLTTIQTVNFIRFIALPVPLLKVISVNIDKDRTISLYCIKLLVKMLQTLKKYIEILEIDDINENVTEIKHKLENFLPKHVPPPSKIVSLLNNITNGIEYEETSKDYNLPKVNVTDAMLSLIDLLLLYNFVHPAFFESLESSIDMKKILAFSRTLSNEKISLLKYKIVSLWMIMDSSILSLENSMFKELFQIMLEVYTNEEDNTWIAAKETLYTFFKNTEIFESDENEIHLILYTLRNSKVNPVHLIADVIEYVLTNGQELNEYVRDQVVNFEITDEENKSDLEKLFIDLMNSKNHDGGVFIENKIPSSFIVGSMQFIQNSKEAKKQMKQFLCLYITNLLHSNFSPELTEVLMGDSKIDARCYVANWMLEPVSLSESTCNDQTLLNISKTVICNEDIRVTSIFPFLEISEDVDLLIDDIAYKINLTKSIDSSELFIWAKYLMFCVVRLTLMEKLNETHLDKIEKYFEIILKLGQKHHMVSECRNIILSLLKDAKFIKIYNPVDLNKGHSKVIATKFILNVVYKYTDLITYLNKKHFVLKPYQQKNYNEILKVLIKTRKNKNVNSELTIAVMEIIGLSNENDNQVLEQIFSNESKSFVKEDKEPSLIQDLLSILIKKYSRLNCLDFSQDLMQKLMTLYTNLLTLKEITPNLTKLETNMIEYFENKPHRVFHIKEEEYCQFFNANAIRKTTSQLASVLLKFNKKFINVFVDQINRPEILSQRELTLPLGNVAVTHDQFITEHNEILNKIYDEYKMNIIKFIDRPHKAGQVYINSCLLLKRLIIVCMDVQECQKLFNKSHKFETIELSHIHLLQTIFNKLCVSNNLLRSDYLINYILTMLHVCTNALKECKDDNLVLIIVLNIEQVLHMSNLIPNLKSDNKDEYKKVTDSSIWHSFCKIILKDSLRVKTVDKANVTGPKTLSLLSNLIKLFYSTDHEDIVSLFDMVTSHSEFLNVMLSHHSPEIKRKLLELLYVLITTNKSIMKTQQIPVYLSAYRATRSPCDRIILSILQYYECNDLPVNEYKPYMFGDSAANFYAVRKNKISTLWGHPSANQVLNLFEKEIIEKTVRHFPVNEKLDYSILCEAQPLSDFVNKLSHTKSITSGVESAMNNLRNKDEYLSNLNKVKNTDIVSLSHVEEDPNVYDPAFLYPLLSHLLAPGSVASCFKLLRSGLLSVAVMGLSSHCPVMRAAAYHVLHRFFMLLETETRHKNDKLLLTDFISTLRQSLSTAICTTGEEFKNIKNPKLPTIGALYLARALMVSTSPTEPLYRPVNNFLIAKQFVDLTVVPDFLSLFHDSEVETVERRNWTLDIIKDGTKTMSDVNVIFKTMCLKMIMDFYSTVLSDKGTKVQILKTLNSIITIPRAFDILLEGYGILPWLHCVARDLCKDDKVVIREILVLLKNMICSVNINAFNKYCSKVDVPEKVDVLSEFKVKSDVEYEILSIVCDVLPSIDTVEVDDLVYYVKLLNVFTKKSIKLLIKKQMINIVDKCSYPFKNSESANLIKQAIVSKNSLMLLSKNIVNTSDSNENDLIEELRNLAYTYVD